MVGEQVRYPGQQEYRDNLAHNLKILRQYGESGRKLAETLLETEKLNTKYMESLGNGRKLGNDVVKRLIEDHRYEDLIHHLHIFEGVNHNELVNKLIEEGLLGLVAQNLYHFKGLDKDIANKLIDEGYGIEVSRFLYAFEGLDNNIAIKLVKLGEETGLHVAERLEMFAGVDYNEIALRLITLGNGESLLRNLENFKGLDRKEIAKILILSGEDEIVAYYIKKFEGLHKEIADMLFEEDRGWSVIKYIENFEIDHTEIAMRIIDSSHEIYIDFPYDLLHRFRELDYKAVAKRLIEKEYFYVFEGILEKLDGLLDIEMAKLLIEKGYGDFVAKNPGKFGLNNEK